MAERLSDQFTVDVSDQVDEATRMLRERPYSAVFAEVDHYLPLERALAEKQANIILNTLGDGLCVMDADGEWVCTNDRLQELPRGVHDRLKETCLSALRSFGSAPPAGDAKGRPPSRKFLFQTGSDRYFETHVSPIVGSSGEIEQVAAVVWEVSNARRLQKKMDAIESAGRELVRLEAESVSKLNVGERLKLLEEKIVRYTHDLLNYDHICLRVLNEKTNQLEVVMSAGLSQEAVDVDLYARPEGNGISGYVAATGRSYICHDVEKDPRYIIGFDHAKAALTVPLRLHDKVIGVFDIEAEAASAFDENDRQFAEIFGHYIAIALTMLDLLVAERRTTSGNMADSVAREMAGPLNDIATEAQTLIDEYVGHDDMRSRLDRILEQVETVRKAVRDVTDPKAVLGTRDVQSTDHDAVCEGRRVLVVDDEPNILETIGHVLTKRGAEAVRCQDGEAAVGRIDAEPFALVISDIRLPQRNGYEIFAAARRKDANLPVILMTGFGYDPHHSIVRASQEGLQAVLFKPFKVEQLLEEVRKALGGAGVETG